MKKNRFCRWIWDCWQYKSQTDEANARNRKGVQHSGTCELFEKVGVVSVTSMWVLFVDMP